MIPKGHCSDWAHANAYAYLWTVAQHESFTMTYVRMLLKSAWRRTRRSATPSSNTTQPSKAMVPPPIELSDLLREHQCDSSVTLPPLGDDKNLARDAPHDLLLSRTASGGQQTSHQLEPSERTQFGHTQFDRSNPDWMNTEVSHTETALLDMESQQLSDLSDTVTRTSTRYTIERADSVIDEMVCKPERRQYVSLPAEVRNEVYSYLMPDSTQSWLITEFMLSCQQVRAEILSIMFEHTNRALKAIEYNGRASGLVWFPRIETHHKLCYVTVSMPLYCPRKARVPPPPRYIWLPNPIVDNAMVMFQPLLAMYLTCVTISMPVVLDDSLTI